MSKKVKKQKTVDELLEEALVPEAEQPYEVPENWVYFKFTSILDVQGGTQPPKSEFIEQEKEGYIRLVQIRDFASDKYKTYIPDTPKLRKIEDEDILIARYGASIGRILTGLSGAYNVALAKVAFPKEKIHPRFLFWLLKTEHFQKPLMGISRSAQSGFNKNDLSYFKMPLPPYNEQKRIADKVERLLNKIDEAKQLIDEAKNTFELRRAAILDKAFRGGLTAKWREENQDIETVFKLLESIKEDKISQSKKKKVTNDEVTDIPYSLPSGWSWITLGEIADMQNGLSKRSGKEGKPVPVLRLSDIQGHNFTLENPREILLTDEEYEKYKIRNGDVLFIRVNGSFELVGKAVLYDLTKEAAYNDHLIKATLSDEINILYIWYLFESPLVRNQLANKIVSSAGQNTISQTSLSSLLIPIPPVEEMNEIVGKISSILNNDRDHLEKSRVDEVILNLRQSILSIAFRGDLGTNDPTEESSIELLKEVLEEKVK